MLGILLKHCFNSQSQHGKAKRSPPTKKAELPSLPQKLLVESEPPRRRTSESSDPGYSSPNHSRRSSVQLDAFSTTSEGVYPSELHTDDARSPSKEEIHILYDCHDPLAESGIGKELCILTTRPSDTV